MSKAKSNALNKKKDLPDSYYEKSAYGLPHGERETPQLRRRFKNYYKKMQKEGGLGYLDKQQGGRILKQNNFYEFNKPEYD